MATRWRPDTCECVIEFDGHDKDGEPIFTKAVLCEKHSHPSETLAENRAINVVVETIKADLSLSEELVTKHFDYSTKEVRLLVSSDVSMADKAAIDAVIADTDLIKDAITDTELKLIEASAEVAKGVAPKKGR